MPRGDLRGEAGVVTSPNATTLAGVTPTAAGLALLDDATAADQRTTLGLGTIATQAANNVSISGGSITGITDLAVSDGGTGGSTPAAARDGVLWASSGALNPASPYTVAAGVWRITATGSLTVNLPALSTFANTQPITVFNDSASSITVTFDPDGTDTIDGGSAGASAAYTVTPRGTVGALKTGATTWGSVQPGGVGSYNAPTIHMYPSGTSMMVAIEVYSGGAWVAVKGPTAVSRTAGSSGNNASISGSAIASASGYATLSDQPLEGDSWREPLDGTGVLAATWTPGAAGWLRIEVTSDQPTVTYYQVYGYAGHPTPGSGPGLRTGWGRGGSTKAVHVASDNNTDGGTSPAATATGPAIAYWEWDAAGVYTARGWGRVSGGVIEDNPATPPATPTTMAVIAGVLRPVLAGGTLSATLDVRVYPAPGTLTWTT